MPYYFYDFFIRPYKYVDYLLSLEGGSLDSLLASRSLV